MYTTVIVFVEPLTKPICYLVVPLGASKFHYITQDIWLFWCVVWNKVLQEESFFWLVLWSDRGGGMAWGSSTTGGRWFIFRRCFPLLFVWGGWFPLGGLRWQLVKNIIIQVVHLGQYSCIWYGPEASKKRMVWGPEIEDIILVLRT